MIIFNIENIIQNECRILTEQPYGKCNWNVLSVINSIDGFTQGTNQIYYPQTAKIIGVVGGDTNLCLPSEQIY